MRDMPCELRADMQQYYGLDLDGMGTAYSYAHAACLCAQLPAGARVYRGTALEWTSGDYMLSHMEHTLRVLAWQQTEDAAKRINYPRHIDTPASMAQLEQQAAHAQASRAWIDGVLANKQPQGGE